MVVEVEAAVLRGGEAGDAFFGQDVDIFACLGRWAEGAGADGVECLRYGLQPCAEFRLAGEEDAVGMARAEIGLDGADVVGDVGCGCAVFLDVGGRALASLLLRSSRR